MNKAEFAVPGRDEFVAWWRRLPRRDGALTPRLSDCLDHADPTLAPSLVIVDVVSPALVRIRLFGTALASTFGEITGGNYLDYMPSDKRDIIGRMHIAMCAQPCGRITLGTAITNGGREVVLGMACLPLASSGRVGHIIKLVRIIDALDLREGLCRVEHVFQQGWVDVGAGTPRELAMAS